MNHAKCVRFFLKRCVGSLFALLLLLSRVPLSGAGDPLWSQLPNPRGGVVQSLACHEKDPRIVYAGTSMGMFVSRDGGKTWSTADRGIPLGTVVQVVTEPSPPTAYALVHQPPAATSYNGRYLLLRTDNSGESWTEIQPPWPAEDDGAAQYIAVTSPVMPPILWWANSSVGLYRGHNGGRKWKLVKPVDPGFYICDVTPVHIAFGIYMIERGPHLRILRSLDLGRSWQEIGGLNSWYNGPIQLLGDPNNGRTLFLMGPLGYGPYRIQLLRSYDYGWSWTRLDKGLEGNPERMWLLGGPRTVLFVQTTTGLYRTTDGEQWSMVSLVSPPSELLSLTRFSNGKLIAGTDGYGAFWSTDAGTQWETVDLRAHEFTCLTADPVDARLLYAGFRGVGMGWSTNRGVSWTLPDKISADRNIAAILVDSHDPDIVYTVSDRIYQSLDGGKTWHRRDKTLSDRSSGGYGMVLSPSTPGRLYVDFRIEGIGVHEEWLYATSDGGLQWKESSHLDSEYANQLAIDPVDSESVYMACHGGLYKSTDGGANLILKNRGIEKMGILSMAIDPTRPRKIFVQTDGPLLSHPASARPIQTGLYKSTDAAESWKAIGLGMRSESMSFIIVDPTAPDTLYAVSSGGGVYRSQDGGSLWGRLSGEKRFPSARFVTLQANGTKTLYIGTQDGHVFSRGLE